MNNILTPTSRLQHIVKVSYELLCHKIAGGNFAIHNEASLQMQFGVILRQVGQLYEFAYSDRFSVELETIRPIEPTVKSSKGYARCDISLRLSTERNGCASAAIELKHFKYDKASEAVADNRFAVLQDIENLEQYKVKNPQQICYEILYTDNKNYANPATTAGMKLAPAITQEFTYCNKTVRLKSAYAAEWSNIGEHYFMIVKL